MSEWKTYKYTDIATIVGGGTPKTTEVAYWNGKIPWISIKDLVGTIKYVYSTEKYITELGLTKSSAKLLHEGDIVISARGTIGEIAILSCPMSFNQSCFGICANENIVDGTFLYYLTKTKINALKAVSYGSVFDTITSSTFENLEISLPPLPEQKRIAGILSALDDKIELNRRINANLEAQAMTLYKQWFVDGRQENWTEKKLGDIVDIYDYLRKPLSGQQREKMAKIYPYYGAASLMDYVENYIFDGIYLLLGEDGTVSDENGYPSLQYVWGKFWVNNHAHVLTGKNGYSTEMLYILLKQTNIHSIITGAVQPKINQANLLNLPVVCPPKDILNKYNEIIQPLFTQLRINSEQIKHLSTLRDTLLPKLMNNKY